MSRNESREPFVSVLMSVRNGMPYVKQTVTSILRQTFADWEFVVVDNASNDRTTEYLHDLPVGDKRIRVFFNSDDLGHSGGLNRGLAECKGRWVARIDADDVALPERLERQVAFVAANPHVLVASCFAHYIDHSGRRVGRITHDLTSPEMFRRYVDRNEAIGVLHPGAFMDRETVVALGGYRGDFDPANDVDLWARVSEKGMILVQPEYLMEYRVHGSSIIAGDFRRSRMKYEWARACMRARRTGRPEPAWEDFLTEWNHSALPVRANRWRKMTAKHLYRQAGSHLITGARGRAMLEIVGAATLQPTYALPRLRRQIGG